MRRNLFAAIMIVALSTLAIHAEDPDQAVRSEIPFPFKVEKATLPAGTYRAERLSDLSNSWAIVSLDGKHKAVFLTEPSDVSKLPNQTALLFETVGNENYLSGIQILDQSAGWKLPLMNLSLPKAVHHPRHAKGELAAHS